MLIRFFFDLKPVNGKPLERVGRKIIDLSPVRDMVAMLPGKYSTSKSVFCMAVIKGV